MQKRFCDLCEKPADAPNKIIIEYDRTVLCDSKAKIQIRLGTGFVNHTTGFGGPPDLCLYCLRDIVGQLRQEVSQMLQANKKDIEVI